MKSDIYREADVLAKRPYQVQVFLDETTDGDPVYVAIVPEMPGCIAHGATVEEAIEWLDSAKLDHICFLLERGQNVPEPRLIRSTIVLDMPNYADEDVKSEPVTKNFEVFPARA